MLTKTKRQQELKNKRFLERGQAIIGKWIPSLYILQTNEIPFDEEKGDNLPERFTCLGNDRSSRKRKVFLTYTNFPGWERK